MRVFRKGLVGSFWEEGWSEGGVGAIGLRCETVIVCLFGWLKSLVRKERGLELFLFLPFNDLGKGP